ncbi:MAG: galactokinase, partial [Ruminococcus champanellensis]|nr:galactokinase [Ruminococcus champanellensis]
AVLRTMHFYGENARVMEQTAALEQGNIPRFLALVTESGRSSEALLQNIFDCRNPRQQPVSMALALCRQLLHDEGACRIHGGGFAGTVQAFVPLDRLSAFRSGMEAVLGAGACHLLQIRSTGGMQLT